MSKGEYRDLFGSFLQDANKDDIYDTKIRAVEFSEIEGTNLKVEWGLKGDELIIHLYKPSRAQWDLSLVKKLYALMDEHAPAESRDIGYEDMVDSWYIKVENFTSGKLSASKAAEALCKKLLESLTSSAN
jgi:hypothetical protein